MEALEPSIRRYGTKQIDLAIYLPSNAHRDSNTFNREVAVKVPKVNKMDAEFLDKFRREVGT